MKKNIIFVTGYFGSPVKKTAEAVAAEKGFRLISLDREIEKKDGRSVMRICMTMGEHEYRNQEYSMLDAIASGGYGDDLVVYCGDGVLNDDMSADIIRKHELIITGSDMSEDELWDGASLLTDTPHAFMHFGTADSKRNAFSALYRRQKKFFSEFR